MKETRWPVVCCGFIVDEVFSMHCEHIDWHKDHDRDRYNRDIHCMQNRMKHINTVFVSYTDKCEMIYAKSCPLTKVAK